MEKLLDSLEIRIALNSGLSYCARCEGSHAGDLEWREFKHPVPRQGGGSYVYWATCPTSGDPILMAVIPA